jgi:hypothetical protein
MKTSRTFKIIKNLLKLLFAGLFLTALIIFSCEKDDTQDDAPELPPVESFIIDFSDFNNSDDTISKSTLTHKNWGHAYFKASVWNFIITVTGIVPVT